MPPAASSPPAGRSLQIELFTPSWIQYLAHLYQPDTDAKAAPRAPTATPHWLICVSLEWVKTSWQTCICQADISSLTLSGNVRKRTCLCSVMPLQRSTAPCLYFLFFFCAQHKTEVPAVRTASQMDACRWIFDPCRARLALHRQAADWLHTNTVAAAWHLLRQPRSQSVWSPTLIALNSCQKEHFCLLICVCLPHTLLYYLLCVFACVSVCHRGWLIKQLKSSNFVVSLCVPGS